MQIDLRHLTELLFGINRSQINKCRIIFDANSMWSIEPEIER